MNTISSKKILITGERGFVGKHLLNRLRREGSEVITLTDPKGKTVDIRQWKKIEPISKVKDIDVVYHLAAVTYVPYSWEEPRKTYEVNVLGTLNILELCRLCKVNKLVFISSYVYGSPKYLPVDESHPLDPSNPYMRSKLIAEELCRAYHEDYDLNCVILRPFNIYGKGQDERFLIPSICSQIVKKAAIVLKTSRPKRDYIYISDMIEACVKSGFYNGSDFEIFNIGMEESYSVDEIVKKAVGISKKNVNVKYSGEKRRGKIMNVIADIKKARQKLHWAPKVKLEEGLKFCLDYQRVSHEKD